MYYVQLTLVHYRFVFNCSYNVMIKNTCHSSIIILKLAISHVETPWQWSKMKQSAFPIDTLTSIQL